MIIGMSGYAYSGKDTVGKYLVENHHFTRVAFADALKEVAYILNPLIPVMPENPAANATIRLQPLVNTTSWDNAKANSEVRRILQVLGTEAGRNVLGEDIWVQIVKKKISRSYRHVVITDCRFPNEVAFVKDLGKLWWVDRPGNKPLNSHISERSVTPEDADVVLDNSGDLDFLYRQVDKLLENMNATS